MTLKCDDDDKHEWEWHFLRFFSFFPDHLLIQFFYVPNINFIINYQPTAVEFRVDMMLLGPSWKEWEAIGRKDLTQLDKTRTWSFFVCLLLEACMLYAFQRKIEMKSAKNYLWIRVVIICAILLLLAQLASSWEWNGSSACSCIQLQKLELQLTSEHKMAFLFRKNFFCMTKVLKNLSWKVYRKNYNWLLQDWGW